MLEVLIAVSSVVCVFVVFLLGLLLKRLSELDAKLDQAYRSIDAVPDGPDSLTGQVGEAM